MGTATDQPVTVREVVRRLIAADRYPCLSNVDWREAEILEEEVPALVPTAITSPDDPPVFAARLATLSGPSGRQNRQATFDEIHDDLEAEEAAGRKPFA